MTQIHQQTSKRTKEWNGAFPPGIAGDVLTHFHSDKGKTHASGKPEHNTHRAQSLSKAFCVPPQSDHCAPQTEH